jgi:hypothetical protein
VTISAVAFEEGGVWIVQGVEYDICAHARDAAEVPAAFARAVAENVSIAQHLGRKPLQGIKPAPLRFRGMFEAAVTAIRPLEEIEVAELPAASLDIRLAGHA